MSFSKLYDFSKQIVGELEDEELIVAEDAVLQLLSEVLRLNANSLPYKRKRIVKDYGNEFWESQWGRLISSPNVDNPRSIEGKRFRRRFRLPYPLFRYLVELCVRENIFDLVNKSPIPIELKVRH